MKKLYYAAMGLVALTVFILVSYGIFLNYTGEKNIARQLTNQQVMLEGEKAKKRVVRNTYVDRHTYLEADNYVDVLSFNSGTIVSIKVKSMDQVKKGQVIARVASEEIDYQIAQMEATIAKAETMRNRYKLSFERYQRLKSNGAISLEQYDDVRSNYFGADAEVNSLRAQMDILKLKRSRLEIKAPIDGTVLFIYRKVGDRIFDNTPVAMVGDFNTLVYKEPLSDERMQALMPLDQEWTLKFESYDMRKLINKKFNANNQGYEGTFKARITNIDPPLNVPAALRTVYWSVDNSSGILEPRNYQNVRFTASMEHKALVVSNNCLDRLTENTVYIWKEDKTVERRMVSIGARTDKYTEILSGLKEGEVVIYTDGTGMRNGMKADVKVKESEE